MSGTLVENGFKCDRDFRIINLGTLFTLKLKLQLNGVADRVIRRLACAKNGYAYLKTCEHTKIGHIILIPLKLVLHYKTNNFAE